jgi:hypothetical protein
MGVAIRLASSNTQCSSRSEIWRIQGPQPIKPCTLLALNNYTQPRAKAVPRQTKLGAHRPDNHSPPYIRRYSGERFTYIFTA